MPPLEPVSGPKAIPKELDMTKMLAKLIYLKQTGFVKEFGVDDTGKLTIILTHQSLHKFVMHFLDDAL